MIYSSTSIIASDANENTDTTPKRRLLTKVKERCEKKESPRNIDPSSRDKASRGSGGDKEGFVGTKKYVLRRLPIHFACSAIPMGEAFSAQDEQLEKLTLQMVEVAPFLCHRRDHEEKLPLHDAVQNNVSTAVIEALLLAFPQSPTAQDKYGRTPIAIRKTRCCSQRNGLNDPVYDMLTKGTRYWQDRSNAFVESNLLKETIAMTKENKKNLESDGISCSDMFQIMQRETQNKMTLKPQTFVAKKVPVELPTPPKAIPSNNGADSNTNRGLSEGKYYKRCQVLKKDIKTLKKDNAALKHNESRSQTTICTLRYDMSQLEEEKLVLLAAIEELKSRLDHVEIENDMLKQMYETSKKRADLSADTIESVTKRMEEIGTKNNVDEVDVMLSMAIVASLSDNRNCIKSSTSFSGTISKQKPMHLDPTERSLALDAALKMLQQAKEDYDDDIQTIAKETLVKVDDVSTAP